MMSRKKPTSFCSLLLKHFLLLFWVCGIIKIAELGMSFTWLVLLRKRTFWGGTGAMFVCVKWGFANKMLFVKKTDSTIDMQNRPNDYLYNKLLYNDQTLNIIKKLFGSKETKMFYSWCQTISK